MTGASSGWRLVFVAAGALAAAAPARAQQQAPYREGFWIGVGPGFGSAAISCAQCTDNSRSGSETFVLRMGGTLSRQVLLGGEINAWSRERSDLTESVGDVSFVALWHGEGRGHGHRVRGEAQPAQHRLGRDLALGGVTGARGAAARPGAARLVQPIPATGC